MERVIRCCLAKDPDQRLQNALDVKHNLMWALEQPPSISTTKPNRRRWLAASALILGLGVFAGWGISRFGQPYAGDRVYRVQIDPPEGGRFVFGVRIGGIALSPDGRTAAFVASVGGKSGLWVRPLDNTTAHLLVNASDIMLPFWSPDSKSIGFFSGGKLQRVELAGGTPFVICDVHGSDRGGAWSSDGRIIFANLAFNGLMQVPASGGIPSPLTVSDSSRGEVFHVWPQVLPGGHFLYWVRGDKEKTGIYVASFAKPAASVRLLNSETNALYAPGGDGKDYLLWLRGGTLLAQELDDAGLKLGGDLHTLADPVSQTGVSGPQMNVAVSANGQLLYRAGNGSSQFVWLDRSGK